MKRFPARTKSSAASSYFERPKEKILFIVLVACATSAFASGFSRPGVGEVAAAIFSTRKNMMNHTSAAASAAAAGGRRASFGVVVFEIVAVVVLIVSWVFVAVRTHALVFLSSSSLSKCTHTQARKRQQQRMREEKLRRLESPRFGPASEPPSTPRHTH